MGTRSKSLYRNSNLSSSHYASKWRVPVEEDFNNREEVNLLGVTYASLPPEADREAILLRLMEYFHGYLMKYLHMIVRGNMPPIKSAAGRDTVVFLKTLVPKTMDKQTISRPVLQNVCKTLHLAFKQMTCDDIYDILVLCLMRAVDKYDPTYTDKVRRVHETINESFPKRRGKSTIEFTAAEITSRLGFDSTGCIRLLVRKGFLSSVAGPKKKITGYKRLSWPPPKSFFESGPVGLTYFIQMYFRYYLHEYISAEMSSIESQAGMLQLDYRSGRAPDNDVFSSKEFGMPNADGDFTDSDGQSWSADTVLIRQPLDISEMSLGWVQETNDKLFRNLTPMERNILRMVWVLEYSWKDVGAVLGCDSQTAKKRYSEVMLYLKGHAVRLRKKPSV